MSEIIYEKAMYGGMLVISINAENKQIVSMHQVVFISNSSSERRFVML